MPKIQFSIQPYTLITAEKKCLLWGPNFVSMPGMKTKPRINHGDLTTQLKVRVSPFLLAYLDDLASLHGWTRAEAVRKVLMHHHQLVKARSNQEASK